MPSLRGYRGTWLRGDVLAGLAAGCVVIPQAMAYATIADLPVEVGLYTCMLPMLTYALLGGARALSVSTTSTIAVLVASTLAGLSARDADELLGAAFTLTFLVGLCLLAMRLFRLGSLVENISPATLTGIRLGVGLTVAASQLPNLLGVAAYTGDGGFFAEVVDAVSQVPEASGVTVAVSATSIIVLLLVRRFLPALPGPLLVVAGGIALVALTGVEQRGLALIDHVPTGLPSVSLPVPSRPGRAPARRARDRRDVVPRDRAGGPDQPPARGAADRHRPGAPRDRGRLPRRWPDPDPSAGRRLLAERGQPARGSQVAARRRRHGGPRRPGRRGAGTTAR